MASGLRELLIERFRWDSDGGVSSRYADRSGWLRDPEIVTGIGAEIAGAVSDLEIDVIMGSETSGLALGVLAARALAVGFAPAYKKRRDLHDSDDWVDTGGTLRAMIDCARVLDRPHDRHRCRTRPGWRA